MPTFNRRVCSNCGESLAFTEPDPCHHCQMMKTRFMCERCGATGIEPEGNYNHLSGKYDSIGGGTCTLCDGEGYLGEKPR